MPHVLRLRQPGRDTVLYPAVSYPTYAMGAALAGCRAVPVPPLPGRLGRPRSRIDRRVRRRPRPRAVVELALQSDRRPGRPGRRGGVGTGARACRSSPTSATPNSPGTARPARSSNTASTGWWRSIRSPSARTWPACGWGSTPAIPSWWSSCAASGATPVSWCPARPRRPGPLRWPTTSTSRLQRDRYHQRLTFMAEVLGRGRMPGRAPRGRLLPVGAGSRRAVGRRLVDGRGPGSTGRDPGQSGRSLRPGRRRVRPGGRGAAHGAPGAGGGAPSRR